MAAATRWGSVPNTILEVVTVPEHDPNFNLSDELTLLEQIWWEKLQPLSPKGYNLDDKIRIANFFQSQNRMNILQGFFRLLRRDELCCGQRRQISVDAGSRSV